MCAQVPCTPPGPIIIRLTSAGGSYIRLVLLNVRAPLLASVQASIPVALGVRMQETIRGFHGIQQAPAYIVGPQRPSPPLLPEIGRQLRARKAIESCAENACIVDPLSKNTLLLNAGSRHDGREDSGGPRKGADTHLLVFIPLLAA